MAKKKVVEILDFSSVQEAQATKEKCEMKLQRYPLVKWIALVASVCGVIGGLAMMGGHWLGRLASLGVLGSLATYVMIGGFGLAIKTAGKIAKTGWFLIPIFPIDIFVLIFAFIFALYAMFFCPIIILHSIKKQLKLDLQAAEMYLKDNQV